MSWSYTTWERAEIHIACNSGKELLIYSMKTAFVLCISVGSQSFPSKVHFDVDPNIILFASASFLCHRTYVFVRNVGACFLVIAGGMGVTVGRGQYKLDRSEKSKKSEKLPSESEGHTYSCKHLHKCNICVGKAMSLLQAL